jgi:hypothetical protein
VWIVTWAFHPHQKCSLKPKKCKSDLEVRKPLRQRASLQASLFIFGPPTSRRKKDISIDGHICWNSKCRLSFIICQPRKTNFCFSFSVPLSMYIYILKWQRIYIYIWINMNVYIYECIYIHTGMLPFQRKNEAQAIFLNLLTVCLSFKQKQRNKGKLSICKRIKQTKQTCQSMDISLYLFLPETS